MHFQRILGAVLMTDDTEVYYNAWCNVMGPPAHRLLCTWHVDRAWRRNLAKVRGDKALQATVYKTIRALMELTDATVFDKKLGSFLATAKNDGKTADFAKYFENEYATRADLWAFSRRLGLQVHHNMHLEALHRVLKHVHMHGRKVKRLDKSLFALTTLMRRKMYDRIIKIYKGKWTKHLSGIRTRHKRSTCMDVGLVKCINPNKMYSVGITGSSAGYLVEARDQLPHCERLCPLHCSECNVCIHYFSCNCLDSGLRRTICKHVHLVMRTSAPDISTIVGPEENIAEVGEVVAAQVTLDYDIDSYAETPVHDIEETVPCTAGPMQVLSETTAIIGMSSKQQQTSLSLAQEHCNSIMAELYLHPEIAPTMCNELQGLRALCSALIAQPQMPTVATEIEREPANKLAVRQRQFMSTKQKPKKRKPELTLCKPSTVEKKLLLDALDGTIEVISRNNRDTDHDYDVCTSQIVDFEHSY